MELRANKQIPDKTPYQKVFEEVVNETPPLGQWVYSDYEVDQTTLFIVLKVKNPENEIVVIRLPPGVEASYKKKIKEALIEHEPLVADYV